MMKEKSSGLYRCKSCGMVVEALPGIPVPEKACREAGSWEEVAANTTDGAVEKHLPVVTVQGDGIFVKVGSAPHPMTPEHYITWIEVRVGNVMQRVALHPGEAPQAFFDLPMRPDLVVRAYCNLHGLWQKE